MHQTIRLGFGLGLLCLAAAGCSGSSATSEQSVGSVGLAVQATGPDGATYRLTRQTLLWVYTADHSFADALYIDGPDPVQIFDLPPNDYFADVVSTLPGGNFEMERSDGSQTELVGARFVGVNPTPFTITADRSTSLTLPFRIPDIGDVTFDTGRLGVDLDVGFEAEEPNQGQVTLVDAQIETQTLAGDLVSASEYLAASDASVTQTFGWNITGPFALTGYERACAPIEFTWVATSEAAWAELFSAVRGTPGTLCVTNDAFGDRVTINGRQPANVAENSLADYLTGPGYEVHTSISARIAPTVFDGTTLHLDQLVSAPSQGNLSALYWLVSTDGVTQAQLNFSGAGEVQTWAN